MPGFARGGGDPREELVARVLTDHVEIRARAGSVGRRSTPEELGALGERLAAHVRLEEDELFPLIAKPSTRRPRELGAEVDAAEQHG